MMDECLEESGPRRLISGGAWFLALMILSGVFWFLLGIQITRAYGASGYGLFSMAQSLFDFTWAFIFGGIFEGLIHFGTGYLTKEDSNLAKFFSKYVRYLTGMSIVAFLIIAFISFQMSDALLKTIGLSLAFAFLFSGTKDALSSILGSLHKSKQLSIVNSVGFYVVSILGMAIIMLKLPVELLPVLVVFAPISQLLLCMYFLRTCLKDLAVFNIDFFKTKNLKNALVEDFKNFKHILVFGFSVSIGKISFIVMKNLDIPILNLFFDFTNVGIYSVADAISSVLFSMTAFSLPIISSISEAWTTKDDVLIEKYTKISVKYPLILGIPLTAIIFTLAEPLVIGVYTSEFQGAVVPLQILIIGTFLLMLGYTLTSILVGIGKAKLSGTLMAVGAIQYLICLFVFVPSFGLNGAAISLTLTGATSLFLIPVFIRKHLRVDVFSGLHKVLFSVAVLFVFLYLIPKDNIFLLIFGTAIGVAIYVLLLRYTGYLTQEDINLFKHVRPES
ncbi:MAG: polysaccharide biosynthesis C-terminal domain-containing protein [Candidatus Bathyarchaeota archaeon]|nr:polysaccharide biosynthesis C-terminal domain-containing protein [Candidatus Bathyarchaeum sp.]